MAKQKRTVVGSVIKGKDGKPDYIKIKDDITLKAGQFLNLESKANQQAKLKEVVAAGKLSAELAEKINERLEKLPDWVRFEIVAVEK